MNEPKDLSAIRRANMAKARAVRDANRARRAAEALEQPRTREAPPINRDPIREEARADNRWEKFDYQPAEDDDRFKILPSESPDGMSYQWVASKVFGQEQPHNLARFQKQGWQPVPASRHDGRFMPKGHQGYIEIDGLMLHERPMEYTRRAREHEYQKARAQVRIREQQLASGDIPGVAFDTQHPSALRSNRIQRSHERLNIPEE
jgi:hypothetical protein